MTDVLECPQPLTRTSLTMMSRLGMVKPNSCIYLLITTTVNSHNSLSLRRLRVLSVSYPKMILSVIGVSSSPSFQCEPAHEHCDGFCQEQGGSQNSSLGIHQ